jgi:hypothetical protein
MISVIISVNNDAASLGSTLSAVYGNVTYKRLLKEVIVVGNDHAANAMTIAEGTGATIVRDAVKCRAKLLNMGAYQATGKILYFVPAGTIPPKDFISDLAKAYTKGFESGTFSLQFKAKHWLLDGLAWMTQRYSWLHLSDQSLFMTRELFEKSGGFREDHLVMADQEMIRRLKRYSRFVVINDQVISFGTQFIKYGVLKTGIMQSIVYLMHKLGYPQHSMSKIYRRFLRWDIGPKLPEREKNLSNVLQVKEETVTQMTLQQPS